ncbi:FUSC family protein [Pusillimonas sp. T2]|uniref:FUSC family protein n=1 Tax=Pusillimonas sp. T2 TaxID=1548123 RepID=UPI000B9467A2|nr:FUSC family protein [Pusillimonas sp. T2]OXR49734.1 FUSC family protein [Pusillimonas sp. T2]
MSGLTNAMARWGFDLSRLGFYLRTAVACCLAVFIAWMLGLEHPQWSGMTVWVASQSTRGHLIEKGLFRVAGTIIGALVGMALVALANGQVLILVAGLAMWSAVCVGIGNVQRGFVSYGTILAGYSAAMVALLGSPHPESIIALGADRMLTVLTGVAVALLAGWFFARRSSEDLLADSLRQLSGRLLRHVASRLRGSSGSSTTDEHTLLAEVAMVEESLDMQGAGSWRSKRSIHAFRALLSSHVSVLLWLKATQELKANDDLALRLEQAAQTLETGGAFRVVRDALGPPDDSPEQLLMHIRPLIERLAALLPDGRQVQDDSPTTSRRAHLVVLHRDWVGARHALLRAGGAMLLIGVFWWWTGWNEAAYMLLGTSVMITLFSTFDNPARTMHAVIAGQVMGVAGALACRWLAWPLATSEAQLLIMMVPFILLGAFVISHRRTMASGFDYNMVMLLLLQPAYPLADNLRLSLATAVAVLCAPLFAFVAYRLVYPTDARRRMQTLMHMMVQELQNLAGASNASKRRNIWRARLYHRLMRLVAWGTRNGYPNVPAIEGGVAVLTLGNAIFLAHEMLERPSSTQRLRRRLRALLKRISRLSQNPERVVPALRRTAAVLSPQAPNEAILFERASQQLADNLPFFQQK